MHHSVFLSSAKTNNGDWYYLQGLKNAKFSRSKVAERTGPLKQVFKRFNAVNLICSQSFSWECSIYHLSAELKLCLF